MEALFIIAKEWKHACVASKRANEVWYSHITWKIVHQYKNKKQDKKPHQSIDIYTTMWINLKTYEVEKATYKKLYVI